MSIDEADDQAASWVSGTDGRALQRAKNTKAQVIIVADGFPTGAINLGHKTLFLTKNPRLAFGRLIRTFYKPQPFCSFCKALFFRSSMSGMPGRIHGSKFCLVLLVLLVLLLLVS